MIVHAQYKSLLVSSRELSPPLRRQLDRHLEDCPDCRRFADLVAQNRLLLGSLTRFMPPPEIREAVFDAADSTVEKVSIYVPVSAPFLVIPITFLGLAGIAAFGSVGTLGLVFALVMYIGLTAWMIDRRERWAEVPNGDDAEPLGRAVLQLIVTDMLVPALGALTGGFVFLLFCLLIIRMSAAR